MEKIIRKDLVEELAERTGLTKGAAEVAVQELLELLVEAVAEGKRVELRPLGHIEVLPAKARKHFDISRREVVDHSGGYRARFKFGRAVQQALRLRFMKEQAGR